VRVDIAEKLETAASISSDHLFSMPAPVHLRVMPDHSPGLYEDGETSQKGPGVTALEAVVLDVPESPLSYHRGVLTRMEITPASSAMAISDDSLFTST